MGSFFIEFRDPLFSIIIFFSIVFMITFISYWWGRYRRKEDTKDIDRFVQQFRALPSKNELKILISSGALSQKSWLLLANSYYKSGDYEKAIEIYNEILEVSKESDAKKTMFLLGKTYFRAGFLERSKQIFLEILKKYPRTPEALNYLLLVYEHMRDYNSALEVLEPLDELGEDISLDREYLQALSIVNDTKLSDELKGEKLLAIYKENHNLIYMIFEYLFRTNPKLAWENLDHSKSEVLVQVLWNLNAKELNLDIISQSGYLRELYSARGDLNLAKSSSKFELDVLIKLEKKVNATLSFEYVCSSCKGSYPFAFNRCSACHTIDSATIEITLSRDYMREFSEESNSFQ